MNKKLHIAILKNKTNHLVNLIYLINFNHINFYLS